MNKMDKKYITVKTVIVMLCAVILALSLALTLYAYRTPKVYVMPIQKGVISGELYDCVVPKEALFNGETLYIVTPKETVLGTRYRCYGDSVGIKAEENGMAAVEMFSTNDEMMIVLAHDGRLKGSGDVLVYRS